MNTFVITKQIIVGCWLLGLSGCAAMQHLPYNHMCPPHGSCPNECNHQQPVVPPMSAEQGIPTLADDGSHAELAVLRERMDALEAMNSNIQEQMVSLDQSLEAQRLDRKQIMALMESMSTAIADVRRELGEQRDTVSSVASRIKEQRTRNDRLLSDVEQQINEVLSQYESAESSSGTAPEG